MSDVNNGQIIAKAGNAIASTAFFANRQLRQLMR